MANVETYELNLAPGRTFNAPVVLPIPDLGTDPLLVLPEGATNPANSVNPGPTRPGQDPDGIAPFLVDQDVSSISLFGLYNGKRTNMVWLTHFQLTVDESFGPMGSAVFFAARPLQDPIPIALFGPGEVAEPPQRCLLPFAPSYLLYCSVQDAVGAPLPGEHKLTLGIVGADTICDVACALRTSTVNVPIDVGRGPCTVPIPVNLELQNGDGSTPADPVLNGQPPVAYRIVGTNIDANTQIISVDGCLDVANVVGIVGQLDFTLAANCPATGTRTLVVTNDPDNIGCGAQVTVDVVVPG